MKIDSETQCIVRVATSWWGDSSGLQCRKSIRLLRRLCGPNSILELEINATGADDTRKRIVNLDDVADGVYRVTTTNEHKDWETGIVDDYDLELVPYVPDSDNLK